MKQVFNYGGNIVVKEIPAPLCGDNEILVSNRYSLISAGTESSLGSGSSSLFSKIRENPELIQCGIDLVKREGLKKSFELIKEKSTPPLIPLGYSSSGIVLKVGNNVTNFAVGDKVACAGAGYANHAEIISVPINLVTKVPENVDFDEATFTTIGAIALQGIRRSKVQIGDNVVVLGLGLLGQIACQILKAGGAHVIGIDTLIERNKLAEKIGAEKCFIAGKDVVKQVNEYTNGVGADSVIIYAATKSSEPVKQAMEMVRKKGNVVVVGDVGMDIDRSPFYEKELDFLISCSYGPGRYDKLYEEKGNDYPIGYVRWTENRNMQEFLNLISQKKIDVSRLINYTFEIQKAPEAYKVFEDKKRPIGVLFKYGDSKEPLSRKITLKSRNVENNINVAVIGAGTYSQTFHLPNLKKMNIFNLKAIVTHSGPNARKVAEKYGSEYFTTDYKEAIGDESIDLVMISTRHNLHAPLILEAAALKKDIFVEKPLAMTYAECKDIYNSVKKNKINLIIGFNRRLSFLAQKAKKAILDRKNPLMVIYRVNSAGMSSEHWINDPVEGGGAIIGECCHFFDFCNWIIDRNPNKIYAEMISTNNGSIIDTNNVSCIIKYEDGSVASIIYNTIGNESFSKERIEIFGDKCVISIDDFKKLNINGLNEISEELNRIDKGQFELLKNYGKMLSGEDYNKDIPTVEDGVKATICSLKVLDSLKTGNVQDWNDKLF